MAATTSRGIQATLADYFADLEYFSIEDAKELVIDHQERDVNRESIRARIYEGIDKGLFERVGKGLYTVTRKDEQGRENTCLLINGDGRDLSMFPDNSVDALICDHPYSLPSSLKGRNRNFADYELFQYTEEDFQAKLRILKPGHFLVEFLPEENGDNYQYLYQIKEMARKAGFVYYAKVPWRKGDRFVANTGRKSKNTEDICFFTKGRARDLRPDAQKNKAEPGVEHFMSGAAGMLPTVFDVAPPKNKIHQAEKPVQLLEQILRFVTKEDELVLDQFAGSGSLGEAALNTHRNSILIEKDAETYQKLFNRISALGQIETVAPEQDELINISIDALEAVHDGPAAMDSFAAYQKEHGHPLSETFARLSSLMYNPLSSEEEKQQEALGAAAEAMQYADCYKDLPPELQKHAQEISPSEDAPCCDWCGNKASQISYRTLYEDTEFEQTSRYNECADCAILSTKDLLDKVEHLHKPEKKILECSSRGDRRFSALFAKVTIKNKEKSIEEWFQGAKRTADGSKVGKGKPFDHIICPFTGDKLPAKDASDFYRGLWITYLSNHPELVEYAAQFDDFSDSFQDPDARQKQIKAYEENPFDKTAEFFYHHSGLLTGADVIGAYVKGNREHYIASVKSGHWYQNMAAKMKPSLSQKIESAAQKTAGPGGHSEDRRNNRYHVLSR